MDESSTSSWVVVSSELRRHCWFLVERSSSSPDMVAAAALLWWYCNSLYRRKFTRPVCRGFATASDKLQPKLLPGILIQMFINSFWWSKRKTDHLIAGIVTTSNFFKNHHVTLTAEHARSWSKDHRHWSAAINKGLAAIYWSPAQKKKSRPVRLD